MLSSIVEYWKILFVNYDNVQKKVHTYVLQKHVDLKKPCIEQKKKFKPFQVLLLNFETFHRVSD